MSGGLLGSVGLKRDLQCSGGRGTGKEFRHACRDFAFRLERGFGQKAHGGIGDFGWPSQGRDWRRGRKKKAIITYMTTNCISQVRNVNNCPILRDLRPNRT